MNAPHPQPTLPDPGTAGWKRLFALLDTALELAPAELVRWRGSLPADEAPLLPWLDELLRRRASGDTADFLARPANLGESLVPPGPAAGQSVGPYRLLRAIGEGGMATVWMAERADGLLERKVALKLPHAHWGIGALSERMSRERSILASLTHPSIARLYDAGLTQDGRPWLALELVDGEAIDTWAASRGLSLRERVGLVIQVARAVAYAHTQLVVHGDLKPSNILVDAEGRTHLLDFGVAKLLDAGEATARPSHATVVTGRALTPDYASPEQIRGDPIGTASDVYSLGVVAYELLAGTRPYRLPHELGPAALAEALARVERPSASRAAAPALRGALEGDLDAILARALAATPRERYATVDALADDLERHLQGAPVEARVASRMYIADRWVRRHKLETAIVVALVLAAIGGAHAQVAVSLALGAGALAALWQRNRALRQAELARAAQARGEQVKDFVASIFTQAVPRTGQGGVVAAVDLLRIAARRVETDLAGQPAVAAELGALIGASFNELGEFQAAMQWLPKAIERCTRELGATHPLTLQSRQRLVAAANYVGDVEIPQNLLPILIRDIRAARPLDPRLLAAALEEMACVHSDLGRGDEAVATLHESLQTVERALGEGCDEALSARVVLSNTLINFARKPEALAAIAPALPLVRAAHGAERPHPLLITVERAYANAVASNDAPRDAAELLRQVIADQRALDAAETGRVRECLTLLAKALMLSGRLEEASVHFAEATAMQDRLTGGVNFEAAGAHTWEGRVLVLQGRGAEALPCFARSDEIGESLGGEAPIQRAHRASLVAWAESLAGHHAGALAATDAIAAAPERGHFPMRLFLARGIALRGQGRIDEAVTAARLAVDAATEGDPPALEHGLAWVEAARCRLLAGDLAGAAEAWREAGRVWAAGQVEGMAARPEVTAGLESLATG